MRPRTHEIDGLLELPGIRDAATRRATFRQSFASIARALSGDAPHPLDGVAPRMLADGVRVAREDGLFDDLAWLAQGDAYVALYELTRALPAGGDDRRELGRRVVARLTDGNAEVFAAIARRISLSSRKGLQGAAIRARVSLLFASPATAAFAGPLAYTLVSRRHLAREWIASASMGSLRSRRLAAKMLERAALVAAHRASQGDDHAPRIFATEAIAAPFARLLADRDPLVWRHVASARGLLAGVAPPQWRAVSDGLLPKMTPTDWRRSTVALVAAVATAPARANERVRELLAGPLLKADPGLLVTAVWGLPRVFDAEPELAEQLLDLIVAADPTSAAEGVVAILRDFSPEAARRARTVTRAALAERSSLAHRAGAASDDELSRALAEELIEADDDASLRGSLQRAMGAYAERGAREAYVFALEALEVAKNDVRLLEAIVPVAPRGPDRSSLAPPALNRADVHAEAARLLRDLDEGLLEESTLDDLLSLAPGAFAKKKPGDDDSQARALPSDELSERLGRWLLDHEQRLPELRAAEVGMSARRLKALMHLVDAEGATGDEGEEAPRITRIRARRIETVTLLFDRLVDDRRSPLHRARCAALARALDALVRDGTCEAVDVLLIAADRIDHAGDLATLARASLHPDVADTLLAYARFVRAARGEDAAMASRPSRTGGDPAARASTLPLSVDSDSGRPKTEYLLELAAALGDDGSGRAESLRAALSRIARSLQNIAAVGSRSALAESAAQGTDALAGAAQAFAQLLSGARRRLLNTAQSRKPELFSLMPPPMREPHPGAPISIAMSIAPTAASALLAMPQASSMTKLSTRLARVTDASDEVAAASVAEALVEIRRLLPEPIALLVDEVMSYAASLPLVQRASMLPDASSLAPMALTDEPLPSWLGVRRTLGGFHIVRPLGAGGAASVFVAKRQEDRHDPAAEFFALKVPDYDGAAARSLSEQQFLDFFRAEASALLGLPHDPNLARFVTFDLAARPKPILVMELIEGPTLERFIESASAGAPIAMARAFEVLDGVLAGLETMHKYAIGHLDVKPSNVILRHGKRPALVDFGLAGRHVRPGCATSAYGAPEIWAASAGDDPTAVSPLPADVYAFGALAFELLTARTLFDSQGEVAVITQHLVHDGDPPALRALDEAPAVRDLLKSALRRDPKSRVSIPLLRTRLRNVGNAIATRAWPLGLA